MNDKQEKINVRTKQIRLLKNSSLAYARMNRSAKVGVISSAAPQTSIFNFPKLGLACKISILNTNGLKLFFLLLREDIWNNIFHL